MRVFGLLAVAGAALWAAQAATPDALAQDAAGAPSDEGTIIQIGPDRSESRGAERRERRRERRAVTRPGFAVGQPPIAASKYWIGLGGSSLPAEVRAQVDLPADEGVLVRTVAPEGPAAQAGVQPFDIVRRANDQPIDTLQQLADVVVTQAEQQGSLVLDVLRRGQPLQLEVTPVERPAQARLMAPRADRRGGLLAPDAFGGLEGLLGEGGLQFDAVPGLDGNLGQLGQMLPELAAGAVSVNVTRNGDGPAKITVRRGEETWEMDEGDEAAMAALPDDVRPMVEQLLQQNAVAPGFGAFGLNAGGMQFRFGGDGFGERLLEMQERMRALREQMADGAAAGGDAFVEPEIEMIEPEIEEAPRFEGDASAPAASGPIELEIPADSDKN